MTYESARQFFEDLQGRADPSRAADLTRLLPLRHRGRGQLARRRRERRGHCRRESQDPADCVIATDEQTFLGVVGSEQNPMGAFMTGRIRVEGDMGLALRLKDLVG